MSCSIAGCNSTGQKGHRGKRGLIKGMCQKHYRRAYRYGDPLVSKDIVIGENRAAHPLWQTYMNMLQRCTNTADKRWRDYGGRGIKVSKRWLGRAGFANFISDMGDRPLRHSIDRINNDLGYSPKNCRWATWKQQANNRRNNV